MLGSKTILVTVFLLLSSASTLRAAGKPGSCRRAVIEGEARLGERFTRPIGNGLELLLEPLASGWILRVVPEQGARGDHDYAELATPPYHSVSPLLISTDFAFRAQDAIGWNPRRFRFAVDRASFDLLRRVYEPFADPNSHPTPAQERALGEQLQGAAAGVFEIVDSRLVPGMADQWKAAAVVASHFSSTAHTIDLPPEGKGTPLGRIEWLRFRVRLDLPGAASFRAAPGLKVESEPCPEY